MTDRTSRISGRLLTLALAAGVAALAPMSVTSPRATAAPEPSPVPLRWQLDLEPGPLKIAFLNVPEVGPRAYLYMTYKVVNNTGGDMYFAPTFELSNDEGDLLRAGRDVPTEVNRLLLEQLKNPFLKDQTDAIGALRQGEENAREGLVVWPAQTLKADRVTVYCIGFSGETKRVTAPAEGSDEGKAGEEVVLRKTLMLIHTTPGELTGADRRALARTETRWILR